MGAPKAKKQYRYRSAVTGRYVSAEFARTNPRETVREPVPAKGRPC